MKGLLTAFTLGFVFNAFALDEVFIPSVGTYCLKMEKVIHRVYENTSLGPQGDHYYFVGAGAEGAYMIKPLNGEVFKQLQKYNAGEEFCVIGTYNVQASRNMAIEAFEIQVRK